MGCWKFESNDNKKIINPVDLTEINDNIRSSAYKSLEACISDFEWLYHDCVIYFSGEFKYFLL